MSRCSADLDIVHTSYPFWLDVVWERPEWATDSGTSSLPLFDSTSFDPYWLTCRPQDYSRILPLPRDMIYFVPVSLALQVSCRSVSPYTSN